MLIYISVPIGSIQGILRHENRTTTEIYLHSIGEAEKFAMVRPAGFGPATYGFVVRRSIRAELRAHMKATVFLCHTKVNVNAKLKYIA